MEQSTYGMQLSRGRHFRVLITRNWVPCPPVKLYGMWEQLCGYSCILFLEQV